MAEIRIEDEQILIGDTVLPGIFESIEVEDDTQVDQVEIQGQKKKANQRVAYNPTMLRLNLKLLDDDSSTALNKLKIIRNLYRPSPSTDTPQIYRMTAPEAQAHGVDQVTFASMRSRSTNLDDILYLALEFEEYVAIKVTIEERPASSASTGYTVQPGDTLGALAMKYGTTVEAIAVANNIADVNLIYSGQTLKIPTPGTKSTSSASGGTSSQAANSTSWTDADIALATDDDTPPDLDWRLLKGDAV
ncbi:hypothetical protein JCM15765_02670 [Paradesulfitobacterium aromaticivorans]